MGLKSLKLAYETVALPDGQTFEVRGMSLVDILAVARGRLVEIEALFQKFAAHSDLDAAAPAIGAEILHVAPEVAALIIAHASGGGDDADVAIARNLPFTIQLDALEKIGRLTVEAGGGLKKTLETVVRTMRGTTDLLADLRNSPIGSRDAGVK